MKSSIGGYALMLALGFVLVASAASADPRQHGWSGHRDNGGSWSRGRSWDRPRGYDRPRYDPGTAFWGGVVGGVLGNMFRPDPPVIVQAPPIVVQEPRSIEWCMATFRSYDPETGYYTAYDGRRLPCP